MSFLKSAKVLWTIIFLLATVIGLRVATSLSSPEKFDKAATLVHLREVAKEVERFKKDCGRYPLDLKETTLDDKVACFRPNHDKVPIDLWGEEIVMLKKEDRIILISLGVIKEKVIIDAKAEMRQ